MNHKDIKSEVITQLKNEGLKILMKSVLRSPGVQTKQLSAELDRPVKTIGCQIKILVDNKAGEVEKPVAIILQSKGSTRFEAVDCSG